MNSGGHSLFVSTFGRSRAALVASALVAASLVGFVLLQTTETRASEQATSFTSADFLTQTGDAVSTGPARIKYKAPTGIEELDNGSTIALSDDIDVTITVSPYPPSDFDVSVELLLTDANGAPINGAALHSDWDMIFMFHGPFESDFTALGDGRYAADFDLFMFGPWEFATSVATPGSVEPETLTFSIYTWPE